MRRLCGCATYSSIAHTESGEAHCVLYNACCVRAEIRIHRGGNLHIFGVNTKKQLTSTLDRHRICNTRIG